MSMLNELGKHLSSKMGDEKPESQESESPIVEATPVDSGSTDAMHDELATMICPDCHKQVQAIMVKHGMMANPSDKASSASSDELK